ncbi:MAG TPA: hypothetical protein PK020_16940 [Ilumatobacteraceae bacterium]|nr:hypothetical protein [Ilumatobacteraceae bacterium]
MSTHHPNNTTSWPTLHPGDTVLLRNRTQPTHIVTTVARTLPATDGDGPGITDTHGHSYRHYYFTADRTATAQEISDSIDALAALLEKISTQLLNPAMIDDIDDAS